jgi:integrase
MSTAAIARLPRPDKKRERFPIVVRNGCVSAKIYRLWRKFKTPAGAVEREVYSLSYTAPEGRKVRQFGRLSSAKSEARLVVDQIAAGEAEGAIMTKADRAELIAAREITGDVTILNALAEWKEAKGLVGAEVIAACRAWNRRHTRVHSIPVAEAVKKFTEAKQTQGVEMKNSYEHVLNRFKADFGTRMLDHIHARDLTEWLNKITNATTRNTYRKRIVTLFRWARDEEFLPRDLMTEAERTKAAQEKAPDRALITPQIFEDLLNGCAEFPTYLPAVIVTGFCGLRSSEAHAQKWEDIDLSEGYLNVTKAKEGTPAHRYVKLCDAAKAWLSLTPEKERKGLIHPYTTEVLTLIRRYAKDKPALDLPSNCLRKSWISHRLAVHPNIAEVSLEAGHGASVEIRNYRGIVKKEQGEAWFKILPNVHDLQRKRVEKVFAECRRMERLGQTPEQVAEYSTKALSFLVE